VKLRRSPHIVAYWSDDGFHIEEFVRQERSKIDPLLLLVLHAFSKPRTVRSARRDLRHLGDSAVQNSVRELRARGYLVPAGKDSPPNVVSAWRGSFPAAYFHFTRRNVVYAENAIDILTIADRRLSRAPQPRLFKDYKGAPFRKLPRAEASSQCLSLPETLRRRRTVREFLSKPVSLASFGSLLRGTFGATGRIDGGIFGRLLTKTSPSAGARHPIECYVLVWNVRGVLPGLYHYSVRRNGLERIRAGDFRQEAVQAASGQRWVADAAFLCVLTVVADRIFWKYSSPDGYRLFLLDAGHIAQTFCLIATSAGLGPFTTQAIQESFIEKLLGIDGVHEFPIYLCGAGVPDPARAGSGFEVLANAAAPRSSS
jgi:SagB-type dehydrogenase family enzyme